MNNFKSLLLITTIMVTLSACTNSPKQLDTPLQDLNCADTLTEIDRVETLLTEAEALADHYRGGINNVHTGGSVGMHGGSSSGVGVGVGISIGSPFGSSRYKRAKLEAEALKTKLIALQKQAIEKKC